uniref:heavy-metal-associated domain-containing protein n=1 Tax=Halalkalirubrum salinum TaxID=2563889 RepID=UPI001F0CEF61
MSCSGCESAVESAIDGLSGVSGVRADHESGTVVVDGDPDRSVVAAAIEDAGYTVS